MLPLGVSSAFVADLPTRLKCHRLPYPYGIIVSHSHTGLAYISD